MTDSALKSLEGRPRQIVNEFFATNSGDPMYEQDLIHLEGEIYQLYDDFYLQSLSAEKTSKVCVPDRVYFVPMAKLNTLLSTMTFQSLMLVQINT